MVKVTLGPKAIAYPMPSFLIGANVAGKPNFMVAAWGGIACGRPPMISVAIQHPRHTLKGIQENQTFSVNVPSESLAVATDYCGIISGGKTDKVKDCGFTVFYGELGTAPLIEQCPINLECRVVHTLNLGSHNLVIGEVVQCHASEDCLSDGKPDPARIKPLIYGDSQYWALGKALGPAFKMGHGLKPRLPG